MGWYESQTGKSQAQPSGVFWKGSDNNIWYKGDDGVVQNRGAAQNISNTGFQTADGRWTLSSQIADPNPGGVGGPTKQTTGSGSGPSAAQIQGFNDQKAGIYGSARDQANIGGGKLNSSILDLVDSLTTAQQGVDKRAVSAYQGKTLGAQNILDMVSRGIRDSGMMLGNRNAGSSSGAQALARLYGESGRRQLGSVNNQFANEMDEVQTDQQNLEMQRASGIRKIRESREETVNNIVTEARDALGRLSAAMVDADMPTRLAIDQEREAIKAEVMGMLSGYDSLAQEKANSIKASTDQQRRARAQKLASAGAVPGTTFDYSTDVPGLVSETGPSAGELPLFTYNRNNEER